MSQNSNNKDHFTKNKTSWWYPSAARVSVLVIALTLAFTAVWSIKKFYSVNNVTPTSIGDSVATKDLLINRSQKTANQNYADVDQIAATMQEFKKYQSTHTDVPVEIRPLLTKLKHQVRDLIIEVINDPINKGKSADQLNEFVKTALKNNATIDEHNKNFEAFINDPKGDLWAETNLLYGDIGEIKFEYPKDHADLLVATTHLPVYCGEDSSFYLFKREQDQWKLNIAQEANDYDTVAGAQGWLEYAISPKDSNDHLFVVTYNTTPWCTSNWQSIRYQAMRAGTDAYQPKILVQNQETIFLSGDETKLDVTGDGFTLQFDGEHKNPDILVKRHIVKYQIKGGVVKRLRKE